MPVKHDCRQEMPAWLSNLELETPADLEQVNFPLKDVLSRSLYYPASEFDGRPVEFFGGFVHSFVYADYHFTRDEVDNAFEGSPFTGYALAGRKHLGPDELPLIDQPDFPPLFDVDMANFAQMEAGGWAMALHQPFANWYIMDRKPGFEDYGPKRFSLLYLGAEGVAAYQVLYVQRHWAPLVLAILGPGMNYTDFRHPKGLLAWTVLGRSPGPEYVIADQAEGCWTPAYAYHVEDIPGGSLWSRGSDRELPQKISHEYQRPVDDLHADTHNTFAASGYIPAWRCGANGLYVPGDSGITRYFNETIIDLREHGWRDESSHDDQNRRGVLEFRHPNGSKLTLLSFTRGHWYFEPPPNYRPGW